MSNPNQRPNQRLLQILGLGWLAFIGTGVGLRQVLRGPETVVVIDQSYCEPIQWQQLTNAYTALYEQSQARQLQIEQVILLSDFGEKALDTPPTPEEVQALDPFGRPNPQRLQAIAKQYPEARVLTCQASP
ncbi:MAG TPA: hypothetical protein V6D06_03060 [Trichocoleus sp.]